MDPFLQLMSTLSREPARYVLVGVAGVNYYVTSKAKANRPKDRLFLETHAEALKDLMDD